MNTYIWNYDNGTTLRSSTTVSYPATNLRGNVVYVHATEGYADQAAVNTETGSDGSEIGSYNYPYNSILSAIGDYGTHGLLHYITRGDFAESAFSPSVSGMAIYSDEKYKTKFTGTGNLLSVGGDRYVRFYDVWISATYSNICSAGVLFVDYSIIESPKLAGTGYARLTGNIITASLGSGQSTALLYNIIYNSAVVMSSNTGYSSNYNIIINCDTTIASLSYNLYNVYWLGSITYSGNTYDLDTDIGTGETEATMIANCNTALSTSFSTSDIGFLVANFINTAKGNFLLDFLNYGSAVTALLTRLNSFSSGASSYFPRGVKLEWDTTEANSDYIFSSSSPLYSTDDGFNGLECQNLNADGSIINTANDTVAVSKIIDLSSQEVLDFLNQFGTFGAGMFDFDELYVRAVLTGNVEDVFNTANGYTANYIADVWSSNLPRMILNREQKVNKVGDISLGKIDLGTFNLNEARNIYKVTASQFQFIAVKKGV